MNIMNPEQKEVVKNYFRSMQPPSATGVEVIGYQALYYTVDDDKLDYRAFKNACKKLAKAMATEGIGISIQPGFGFQRVK